MQFEFFAPFLDAETFLNMHAASDDIDFGVNEDMLCLGAQCGLNPHGLLKIMNDETNGLTPETLASFTKIGLDTIEAIMACKNAGVPAEKISTFLENGFSLSNPH